MPFSRSTRRYGIKRKDEGGYKSRLGPLAEGMLRYKYENERAMDQVAHKCCPPAEETFVSGKVTGRTYKVTADYRSPSQYPPGNTRDIEYERKKTVI